MRQWIRWALAPGAFAIGTFILYRQLIKKQSQVTKTTAKAEFRVRAPTLPRSDTLRPTRLTADELTSELEASFRDVYRQLISVIQGVTFGYLASVTFSNINNLNIAKWLALLTCMVALLIVWHEYMVVVTAVAWIPTILDTTLPFGLGIAEFAMITFAVRSTREFLLASAIAYVIALVACGNSWFHARRGFPISTTVHGLISRYIRFQTFAAIGGVITTWALFSLSLTFASARLDLIYAACTFVTTVPMLVHSIWQWNLPLLRGQLT